MTKGGGRNTSLLGVQEATGLGLGFFLGGGDKGEEGGGLRVLGTGGEEGKGGPLGDKYHFLGKGC